MPKRVVDGDAMWRSRKLKSVREEFRMHYANWIPMANHNGVFEASPDSIWSIVYAFLMPHITEQDVAAMLTEFERCNLIDTWEESGKRWGFFVGMDKPGRLPSEAHKKRYAKGFPEPRDISGTHPGGIPNGFGFGSGLGIGKGKEEQPLPLKPESQNLEGPVNEIGHLYPGNRHLENLQLPPAHEYAICEALNRDGVEKVMRGTKAFAEAVKAGWKFIPNVVTFYGPERHYLKDPSEWRSKDQPRGMGKPVDL